MAGWTGLEPATSDVTGRQLSLFTATVVAFGPSFRSIAALSSAGAPAVAQGDLSRRPGTGAAGKGRDLLGRRDGNEIGPRSGAVLWPTRPDAGHPQLGTPVWLQ